MKKILIALLLIPGLSFAKSYVVDMKVCDKSSNYSKCYETVKITYVVNTKSNQVNLSGRDLTGKEINEPIDKCQISDERNWICDSAFFTTQISHGQVKILNKVNSSLASNNKEVCLIK
jgi:hypothetical protein